jgi:hypothetical protein
MGDTYSPKAKLTAEGRLTLVRVKIERAKKHLVDLERELRSKSRSKYTKLIMTHEDPQTGEQSRRFQVVRTAAFNSIATAGDVIQNLRTALDHLANQLILVAGNHPTSANCFPISKDFTAYEKDKARRVEGMRAEAKEAIDRVKPYGGGNDFLWRLHRLNIIDKHRLLFTVDNYFVYSADWINHWSGFNTFTVNASQPDFAGLFSRKEEDKIQLRLSNALGEAKILQGDPLLPALQQLVNVVEDLVLSFKPLLQR